MRALTKNISISRASDKALVKKLEEECHRERHPFSQTLFRYLESLPELQDQI